MPLRWFTVVAPLLLSALLVGCGQKGPLYLPDEPLLRETHTHSSAGAASVEEGAQPDNAEQTEPQDIPQ